MVRPPEITDARVGRTARRDVGIKVAGTRHKYDIVRGDGLRIKPVEGGQQGDCI